ncbi:MAG: hypothetical protein KF878_27030 [Planctomycetes bacterium]|nr:hypothetical protein [Planctomycetota bacterium]
MAPPAPAAGPDPVRPDGPRGLRQLRKRRLLAQSGVPLLLFSALLVVVAQDTSPGARTQDGRAGAHLTPDALAAAQAQLAELEAWAAAHPDEAVELYGRARALSGSRVPEVAATAARLAAGALARVDPELRATLAHGEALEADGRDWEADQHYKEFLARADVAPEVARVVRDARGRASGRLQQRFVEDAARVRALVAAGARAEAEALVAEVLRYAGPDAEPSLRALLVAPPAAAATSPPPDDTPVDATLLARALRARVDDAGDGAVRLTYRFDGPDPARDLEDWPLTAQVAAGALLPGHLEPLEPTAHPAWYTAEGTLVGSGWTRRQLVVDFRPDRPVTVEVAARGARNRVASLGLLPGRSFVGGSGVALDLPLDRLPQRPASLEALVRRARERGPGIALLREVAFLDLDEALFRPEPPRAAARVTLDLRPAAGGHTLGLRVGDLRLEPAPVTLDDGPVRAFLVALGSPVAWEEVVVTGVPSPDIARALPVLARDAGGDPDALAGGLRAWLGRRRLPGRQ